MDRKQQILDRQKRVFRIAQDPTRYGLTLKMIAADADLGLDSVRNYAAGETVMPLTALDALLAVLPDELTSLLMPAGRVIVSVPDAVDFDAIEAAARDLLAIKGAAHRADSPAGTGLSGCEKANINEAVVRLQQVIG